MAVLGASLSQAVLLYSNTSETGFRANPGNASLIWFDDAPILLSSLPTNTTGVQPTDVTVGIRRLANAPAVDVTIYTAAFDTSLNLVASSITSLGTTSLAANGASSVTSQVTRTASSPYTVPLVADATFGYMAVGVSLSESASGLNGWRITNNMGIASFGSPNGLGTNVAGSAPNINLFWQWDPGTSTQTLFNFGFTGANQATNPPASFFVRLNGNPVPEPASLAVLGVGAMALLRKRRK